MCKMIEIEKGLNKQTFSDKTNCQFCFQGRYVGIEDLHPIYVETL